MEEEEGGAIVAHKSYLSTSYLMLTVSDFDYDIQPSLTLSMVFISFVMNL